jgi:hypothetical protein
MKERNSFGDTEATHALAVHHQAIITLVVILLLFAGRDIQGATGLAGQLLQDNDQAPGSGRAELESNDLTSVTIKRSLTTWRWQNDLR